MKAKLVGKQLVDFTNNDGQRVSGIKLHIVGIDPRVRGEACITPFFNSDHPLVEVAANVPLGDINLDFGPKNSIVGIESI